MGNRARFTIASVVSLAAAGVPFFGIAIAACGDGEVRPPVFPVEGGLLDVPTRTNEAASMDVVEEAEPDAGPGACVPLGTPIDVLNVEEDPNNAVFGGVVTDGTYDLTSAVYADDERDGGVAFKRAAKMTFSGKNITWHYDTDPEGMAQPTCCAGTWAYNATAVMQMNVTCNGEAGVRSEYYDFHPTGIPDSGADAGAPQLMIHVGALHDIYTKQ